MDNKKLGIALVIFAIILGYVLFSLKIEISKLVANEVADHGGVCIIGGTCIHEQSEMRPQTYTGIGVIFLIFALGIYLIFFDKGQQLLQEGQKEIAKTLESVKKKEDKDKEMNAMLSVLNEDEQKVIKAIKEQDGITQATLRLRIDFSKSKLSAVLAELEKRGLIKRVTKGTTNQVFLKKKI
jgi:uncharacterized membrane protein